MELFKIFGSVAINNTDANRSLNETSNMASKVSEGLKKAGSAISNLGTKITVGTGIVAGAVVTFTKVAISAYAEYEQLVGGVETLFKKSSGKVLKYAEGAYKTAGLSANDYMETVTSFSASLLQSLGGDTEKAAEYSHRAVTDMSDNANKMGTDMSMIQNAYQGFAKQNYTMLDNLKLGYGGTKTEMERLVKDASKLKGTQKELGVTVDANSLSFANIVNAISVVQKEMGIMGTTSKEAEKTITGSINAMKASWTNLLVGMADDNADFEKLFNTFLDNLVTVAKNVMPRVEIVITTLAKKILEGIKSLTGNLPPVFGEVVDKLIWLAENFRTLDAEQKKQILSWIGLAAATGPILVVLGKLTSGFGSLISIVSTIAGNATVVNIFTKLKSGASALLHPINLLKTAFGALKTAFLHVKLFGTQVAFLFNASGGGLGGVMAVLKTGVMSLGSAFSGLVAAIAPVVGVVLAVAGVFVVLKENWDKVVQVFQNFIQNTGLTEKFEEIKNKLQPLWEKIKGLKDLLVVIGTNIIIGLQPALAILAGLFNGLVSAISPLITAIGGVIDILAGLGSFIVAIFTGDMKKAGDSVKKIGQGIVDVFGGLWGAVTGLLKGFVDGVIGWFKSLWDTLVGHSIVPDTINAIIDWFKQLLGKPIEFVRNMKDKVVGFFGNLKDNAIEKVTSLKDKVVNLFNKVKEGITKPVETARDKVKGIVDKIKGFFDFEFKLPKIKTPKFSVQPSGWKIGDLLKGSIPKLGITWNKDGAIFAQPTIFDTRNGLQGVGEAGPEAVAPISKLQDYVQLAVDDSNSVLAQRLDTLVDILLKYLPAMENQQMVLDTGTLVGEITTKMDRSLGDLTNKRARGR